MSVQNHFNDKSQKIVDENEFNRLRFLMEQDQLSWKEKLFQPVNDLIHFGLWIKRGVSEAIDSFRGKPHQSPNGYYFDKFNHSRLAPTYMDRETLEGDLAYFEKNGLAKAFEAKTAKIARDAFDASRDFSVLRKSGQLQKYSDQPGL